MDAVALAHQIANTGDGEALPIEATAWLRAGLRRWLRGEADLAMALRLHKGAKVASRNRFLLEAAAIIDDGKGLKATALADALEQAQRRFEAGVLVQISRGISTPLSPLNQCLLNAWLSGARPLRCARRIYDVLRLTNSP